jgi:hypothetical protein
MSHRTRAFDAKNQRRKETTTETPCMCTRSHELQKHPVCVPGATNYRNTLYVYQEPRTTETLCMCTRSHELQKHPPCVPGATNYRNTLYVYQEPRTQHTSFTIETHFVSTQIATLSIVTVLISTHDVSSQNHLTTALIYNNTQTVFIIFLYSCQHYRKYFTDLPRILA